MKSTRDSKSQRELKHSIPPEVPPLKPVEIEVPDENPDLDDQPRSRGAAAIPGEGPNPTPPEVK